MAQSVSAVQDLNKNHIISVYNPFHIYWDVTLLTSTIYLIIMIPTRISHHVALEGAAATGADYTLIVDYLVDLIFIMDMVLQGRFFAYKDLAGGRQMVISDKVRGSAMHVQ